MNLTSRGGRDSKPELKTSNTKPKTGIKGKPEPKKGMQRARGGLVCIWRGVQVRAGREKATRTGIQFQAGEVISLGGAGIKTIRRKRKANTQRNRKRNPRKNKSPKPGKVVGSFKGRVERKGRHHALIDSCIYIGFEAGSEINAGLNAQKP